MNSHAAEQLFDLNIDNAAVVFCSAILFCNLYVAVVEMSE